MILLITLNLLLVLNFAPIHLPIFLLVSHEKDKFTRLNSSTWAVTCPYPGVGRAPFPS